MIVDEFSNDILESFASNMIGSDPRDRNGINPIINDDLLSLSNNVCPVCKIAMNIIQNNYVCDECGLIGDVNVDICQPHDDDLIGRNIKIGGGMYKGKFYNSVTDYHKLQKKSIEIQLNKNNDNSKIKIPKNILLRAAEKYNGIQKNVTIEEIIPEDKIHGDSIVIQKKFVRRGDIKDEILSALIYDEHVAAGITRSRRDIAKFMKLQTDGFSTGEQIVRNLAAEGKITLSMDNERPEHFVERYVEILNNPVVTEYKQFLIDFVNFSEDENIGMSSHINSKVAGALWLLISYLKIPITSQQLESAADSIKKNTFMKFCDSVHKNIFLFKDIFAKYKIEVLSKNSKYD